MPLGLISARTYLSTVRRPDIYMRLFYPFLSSVIFRLFSEIRTAATATSGAPSERAMARSKKSVSSAIEAVRTSYVVR